MATIVTYKSKYGSAKKYALWLAEELKCEAIDISKVNAEKLSDYDVIIHGGGLYAGGLAGLSFYRKNKKLLNGKKFILYAVGACRYNEGLIVEIGKNNLKGLPEETKFFYCEGNYCYKKMTVGHKIMMKMMNSMLEKQVKENGKVDDWAEGFLDIIFSEFEHIDRRFLAPVISEAKGL